MIGWLIGAIFFICFGLIVLRGAPYVPSHRRQLERAFTELYKLTDKDTLVDLGSGDGIVLRAAARHGAAVIGYELNPFLVLYSWLHRGKKQKVYLQDFLLLQHLPPEVTVVYIFATGSSIESIGRKMQQWSAAQPLHLISYGFELPGRQPLRSVGAMHLYEFKA